MNKIYQFLAVTFLISIQLNAQCNDINLPTTIEICNGSSTLLTVDNANNSSFTYQWFYNNFNVFNGTNSTLTAARDGDYRVEATFTDGTICIASTNLIVNDLPVVTNDVVYTIQDTDCDGYTSFDLTNRISDFTNGNSNLDVQFYSTIINAENDTNEITTVYQNLIPFNDSVAVRINDVTTGCYSTTTMALRITQPTAVNASIEITSPAVVNEIISICAGDMVSFTAVQDPSLTFEWDFQSLGTQQGRIVSQQFNEPGGYFVELIAIDQNGCFTSPAEFITVVVTDEPEIEYTFINDTALCLGDSIDVDITSINPSIPLVCDDAEFVAGTTFLPDGSGVSYETSITIDCFPEGAVLSNTSSFLGVCMNIEHSYLGDLRIELIAPDSTTLALSGYPNNGFGAFLGEPIDDDINISPGIGYDYCFTTRATNSLSGSAGISIPSGDYMTSSPFRGLLNVPLNGEWKLRITDNLASDNGYIFSWYMKFGAGLETSNGFTSPAIVSESWSSNPDITVIFGNNVTITPSQTGLNCYDYVATDAAGCTFTNQYCLEVFDPLTDFNAVDLFAYDSDGDGFETFDLTINTPRLIGNLDASQTDVLYFLTLADAQNNLNPVASAANFTNNTSPQRLYARIINTYQLCDAVIADFELTLTQQPIMDADNDGLPDDTEDLNGNGDLTDDDTDMDGIPNYLDDDDDGDGVPTALETSGTGSRGTNFLFLDTDLDGIENYLDNDDDGDGLLTIDEDYNGNGDPTDDDTDSSGVPDFLESNVTLGVHDFVTDTFQVYPNPFYNDGFEMRVLDTNISNLNLTLFDISGKQILINYSDLNSNSAIKVYTPNLKSGVYFLKVGTSINATIKLIKM
jgi:hypothetical protein